MAAEVIPMRVLGDSGGKKGRWEGECTGNLRRTVCPFAVWLPLPPHTKDLAMDYEDWASNLLFCSKLSSHPYFPNSSCVRITWDLFFLRPYTCLDFRGYAVWQGRSLALFKCHRWVCCVARIVDSSVDMLWKETALDCSGCWKSPVSSVPVDVIWHSNRTSVWLVKLLLWGRRVMGQILHFPCLIYQKKFPFEFSFIQA